MTTEWQPPRSSDITLGSISTAITLKLGEPYTDIRKKVGWYAALRWDYEICAYDTAWLSDEQANELWLYFGLPLPEAYHIGINGKPLNYQPGRHRRPRSTWARRSWEKLTGWASSFRHR